MSCYRRGSRGGAALFANDGDDLVVAALDGERERGCGIAMGPDSGAGIGTVLHEQPSYAWLGAWLGLDGKRRFPGIVSAYAITDDFVAAVINARQDSEAAGTADAEWVADAGAGAVGHPPYRADSVQHRLLPPTPDYLAACHDKVQRLYSAAYGWPAPPLPPERTSSRTMRQYLKGWITQWDLLRLVGGIGGALSDDRVASNYTEDANLAEPRALDDEEA